ncbi:MAG: DNA mismatch repair endonuclease MutL [Candidatus Omnitrophota bacterium]|nr:DNA mismatch repair endonuclease MutL [Candidatus Omnitrophota bacterium]
MSIIHVLSEEVVNKIAAGEVIERPSSIVKELVENSLDAGANSVEIEVKNGGKSLIRIADNGKGMSASDAELAFKRHATSKIKEASDLETLASLGFRGEALSSIAAVSRVKMQTRLQGESVGTEITIEGGKFTGAKQSPCREGTIVEVRDLFFNTPARRKFLRADSTEMGHIMDTATHFGYSRPSIHLAFRSSGKRIFDLAPGQGLLYRASEMMGKEIAKNLLEIDDQTNGIHIHGIIGKPILHKANRSSELFFVNGRWVKSFSFGYALQAGYHGLLMHGQFPTAVLFVDVDLARVDVNVHPTKQEVRISNEAEIKSFIKKAVTQCLERAGDLSPSLTPAAGSSTARAVFGPPSQTSYAQSRRLDRELPELADAPAFKLVETETALETPIRFRDKLRITKVLGQIHNTFIVAETEEGFMLVDQHAAHERVMFEALLKNFESGEGARQNLLMEEVLELHPRQVEIFKDAIPLLIRIGFQIEPFGVNAFVIRSYPAALDVRDPVSFLKTYIEEREEGKVRTQLENRAEDIVALIACKRRSVKAHDPLMPDAVRALLERLAACDNPFSCPHGRPTLFNQTFSELEKHFKRKK